MFAFRTTVQDWSFGLPNLEPAPKAHAKLIRAGEYQKANALELVINNKVWSKQGLLDAGSRLEPQRP